tara:strand:- start:186 stop:488 length:303 start_codon:yes stop_codon:yes gene_type:complete
MDVLHIVNKSPSQSNVLDSCIHRTEPGSAILLIEDAIYALFKYNELNTKHKNLAKIKVYALADDVIARGATEWSPDNIKLIDYAGFVKLTELYQSSVSWY